MEGLSAYQGLSDAHVSCTSTSPYSGACHLEKHIRFIQQHVSDYESFACLNQVAFPSMGKPGKSSGWGVTMWSFLVWELPGKRPGCNGKGMIGGHRRGESTGCVIYVYSLSRLFCFIAGQLLKVGEDVRR